MFFKKKAATTRQEQQPATLEDMLLRARSAGNKKLEFALLIHIVLGELHEASPHYQRALDIAIDDLAAFSDDYFPGTLINPEAEIDGLADRLSDAIQGMESCLLEFEEIAKKVRKAV